MESRRVSLLNKNRDAAPLKLPTQPDKNGKWPFEVVGIPLPKPGLYVVEVSSRLLGKSLLGADKPMYVRTAALVTNMAVHLKRSGENASVWVTTLDKGKPVPDAKISVYDCKGEALWSGKTDKNGIASISKQLNGGECSSDEELSGLFVTAHAKDAQGNEDVSFVRSGWNRGIESWRFPFPTQWNDSPSILAHTILDRPLFRAGETVSMKHLLRVQAGKGLAQLKPNQLPQQLRIVHDAAATKSACRWPGATAATPKAALLCRKRPSLANTRCIWSARHARPDDKAKPSSPELDGYSLRSGSFRVEEFRLPVMTGRIFTAKGANIGAKQVPLNVSMSWGNGGPAKDWPVEVSAMLADAYTRIKAYDGFTFSPPQRSRENSEGSLDGKVVLDKAALKLDANGNGKVAVDKLPSWTAATTW